VATVRVDRWRRAPPVELYTRPRLSAPEHVLQPRRIRASTGVRLLADHGGVERLVVVGQLAEQALDLRVESSVERPAWL